MSALQLVATIGWAGLIFTVTRYVPLAGSSGARLVLAVYGAGVGLATVAALSFASTLSEHLGVAYVSAGLLSSAVFCASVALWVSSPSGTACS